MWLFLERRLERNTKKHIPSIGRLTGDRESVWRRAKSLIRSGHHSDKAKPIHTPFFFFFYVSNNSDMSELFYFKGLLPNTISTANDKFQPKSLQNFLAYLTDKPQSLFSDFVCQTRGVPAKAGRPVSEIYHFRTVCVFGNRPFKKSRHTYARLMIIVIMMSSVFYIISTGARGEKFRAATKIMGVWFAIAWSYGHTKWTEGIWYTICEKHLLHQTPC